MMEQSSKVNIEMDEVFGVSKKAFNIETLQRTIFFSSERSINSIKNF
jgi:hypothetical protein